MSCFRIVSLDSLVLAALLVISTSLHAQTAGGGVTTGAASTAEEFTVRCEPAMGTPDCPPDQLGAPHCTVGPWLETRSPVYVNMKKTVYFRGSSPTPQGVQVTSSFVADEDDTNVAVEFSAEATVWGSGGSGRGEGGELWVRALVDGQPVDPAEVLFASSFDTGTRTFVFTTNVDAGIHTVEMQWKVANGSSAAVRDTVLLVRMGREAREDAGRLVIEPTPPGGGYTLPGGAAGGGGAAGSLDQLASPIWTNVPNGHAVIDVPPQAPLTVTFAAETAVTTGDQLYVRALVDGMPLEPSSFILTARPELESHTVTFGTREVLPGQRSVQMQWAIVGGGTGWLGERSLVLAAFPDLPLHPTHPFAHASELIHTASVISNPIPGMSAQIRVPANGNGEVAVQFTAEVMGTGPVTAHLEVDGSSLAETRVDLTGGGVGQAHSHVFSVKHLAPGMHTLRVHWSASAGGNAWMLRRSMAVMSEVGFIPDLAEAPRFGYGQLGRATDFIGGIEPLIGTRDVLTICIDPRFCVGGGFLSPDCIGQEDLPTGKVEAALYGPGGGGGFVPPELQDFLVHNVEDYYWKISGGRFTIRNAGVLGWYEPSQPHHYYYGAFDGKNCNGDFKSGDIALISEAVQQAMLEFDFTAYDHDDNGSLDPNELAILVVIPRPGSGGSSQQRLLAAQCPDDVRLEQNGVKLPLNLIKWNTSLDPQHGEHQFQTAAHELMHLIAGLDDMYEPANGASPGRLSLMASNAGTTTHLDAFHKLALGWATPVRLEESGSYALPQVRQDEQVMVLPRYNGDENEEYFLLEYRYHYQGMPPADYDSNIGTSGVAVWHIVEDPVDAMLAPLGVSQLTWDDMSPDHTPGALGNMTRRGIRLLHAWTELDAYGDATSIGTYTWLDGQYDLLSGGCPPLAIPQQGEIAPPVELLPTIPWQNTLTWADCTPSGYTLGNLTSPIPHDFVLFDFTK